MGLVDHWNGIEAGLPSGWGELQLVLELEAPGADEGSALLAPLQPLHSGEGKLSLRVTRSGGGPSPDALRRGLARLDQRHLRGKLSLLASELAPMQPPAALTLSLVESWQSALATIPADWSDVLAEIELDSSDYLDRASVHLAPLNPRRIGVMTTLRFRSAQHFGYGASPGVVGACLARCDQDAIIGSVRIERVLCDTKPVATQGPVWQINGEMA